MPVQAAIVRQAAAQSIAARRVEEAALNATAVREQLLYDGWLLRFASGQAKRMRSVSVIGPSRMEADLDVRLARCARLYEQHGQPLILRLTSLDEGPGLDAQLDARGYQRMGETLVMSRTLDDPLDKEGAPGGTSCVALGDAAFAKVLGRLKSSSDVDVKAHAARLRNLVVGKLPRSIERAGAPIAAGLAVVEDELVGIFDVAVETAHRRKGWGGLLVCQLMAEAAASGARRAYLQVDADNLAACQLYERLGFHHLYTYWYRCAPPA